METFIIEGGHPLSGTIIPQGAKNEALEVIAATLLTSEPVRISNIPDILDVNNLIKLLTDIGMKVTRNSRNDYTFQADELNLEYLASDEYVQKCSALRGSVLLMGPLLGRFGRATVAEPGGDKIGRRRLDTHFLGFKCLGAKFINDDERKVYTIEAKHLKGTYMLLDEASVTGTANIIMAAVLAEGTTTIYNAACEPYIQQLCHMLNSMGANIKGAGTDVIRIKGVDTLHGTSYAVVPDMIEAGTYMFAAAATKGDVLVKNVIPKHLEATTAKLEEIGCDVEEFDDAIRVSASRRLGRTHVKTQPYPGYPTDMQPQIAVTLALANGTSIVTESIFENRFKYVDELARMGANVKVEGNSATIEGVTEFSGARVSAPDLRAGAALCIAGLATDGITIVDDIVYIQRGYERFEEKLRSLGGIIERVSSEKEIQKFTLKVS